MKNIVVCDIDGTISLIGKRVELLKVEPIDWESFYADSFEDQPVQVMVDLVRNLQSCGYVIVFFTSRREIVRTITEHWIKKHFGEGFRFAQLLMRDDLDYRSDLKTKSEMLIVNNLYPSNVAFILEDRDCLVKYFRDRNYTVLQVAEGGF
jgi:hypothetical protein